MKKRARSLCMALAMTLSLGCTSCAAIHSVTNYGSASSAEHSIAPLDNDLHSGTIDDATDWQTDMKLSKENGTYISFSATNTGAVDLVLSINDDLTRTLSPGESGQIDTEITGTLTKTYEFKAVPAHSGAISFQYAINQHGEP